MIVFQQLWSVIYKYRANYIILKKCIRYTCGYGMANTFQASHILSTYFVSPDAREITAENEKPG